MRHLTNEIVREAIEKVFGPESGYEPNGDRVEGYSITVDPKNYIYREMIERLRLRLNTIERNAGGTDVLAFWRLRYYQEQFEIRFIHSGEANLPDTFPEGMNLPMYDDEDGDAVDGKLSYVAFMMRVAKGGYDPDDVEIEDFVNDFADRDKNGHYLFCGQKTYDNIRAYLNKHANWNAMDILDKTVKCYRAYCKKHGLKCEKISVK